VYRVLFYNGQFDLAAGTLKYLRALLGDSVYWQAEKRIWRQDGSGNSSSAPRGFVRGVVVNVTALVVARAGHMVPKTQKLHSLELLEHLIRNKTF
jgi:carboxypeptidase C (cathepsin A)